MPLTNAEHQAKHRQSEAQEKLMATKAVLRAYDCSTEKVYYNSPRGFTNEFTLLPIPNHLLTEVKNGCDKNQWADHGPQLLDLDTLSAPLQKRMRANLFSIHAKEYIQAADTELFDWFCNNS